jgi:hypothetical protein
VPPRIGPRPAYREHAPDWLLNGGRSASSTEVVMGAPVYHPDAVEVADALLLEATPGGLAEADRAGTVV